MSSSPWNLSHLPQSQWFTSCASLTVHPSLPVILGLWISLLCLDLFPSGTLHSGRVSVALQTWETGSSLFFIYSLHPDAHVCDQSCPTLCNPMDCNPPGSSVHGISQARILWSGLLFPIPGDLPHPGMVPMSLVSPALADRFFTTEPSGKPSVRLLKHSWCWRGNWKWGLIFLLLLLFWQIGADYSQNKLLFPTVPAE